MAKEARLRYANVYRTRQDPYGEAEVVAVFRANLAAGRASTVNGSEEQIHRDYVYAGDVARANVLALEGLALKGPAPSGRTTPGPA